MELTNNEPKSTTIGFRLSNNQLQALRVEAAKEKRSIGNFIKSKLF
jgi:hypothetical protein